MSLRPACGRTTKTTIHMAHLTTEIPPSTLRIQIWTPLVWRYLSKLYSTLTAPTDPEQLSTPPSSHASPNPPTDFLSRPSNISDDADEDDRNLGSAYLQRKGGYDSRIQQILYENPDLEIVISDAGKSPDGGYIVYRIQTGVWTAPASYGESH